jgi:uncharacterized protein DUF1236
MSFRSTLLSAAGVVLALGLTAAQAQTPGGDSAPSGPPAASPDMGGGPAGGSPAGGADYKAGGPSGTPRGGPAADTGESSAGDLPAEGKEDDTAAGADDKGKGGTAAGKQDEAGTATEKQKSGTMTEGEAGAKTEAKGAGAEGKAGKSAKVDSQQITKVKTYFSQHKPTAKSINKTEISVSIGVALPSAIVLYDLPPDVIVVVGDCPIKYFVWGDDVVLVDSCTREVVEIIVGVA